MTKSGKILQPPKRIVDRLPRDVELDGEIYHSNFQKVRKSVFGHGEWDMDVEFIVFDLFDITLPFVDRWAKLKSLHDEYGMKMVVQHPIDNMSLVMDQIRREHEEGLILRNPQGMYEIRRSKDVLKWKPIEVSHAVIKRIEPKKIGSTLTLQENDSAPTFRVYSRLDPATFNMNDSVEFQFTGRDDKNRPEVVLKVFQTLTPQTDA
jgi:ATP-dependent DNA ligase